MEVVSDSYISDELLQSLFIILWVNSFSEIWKVVTGTKPVKLISAE